MNRFHILDNFIPLIISKSEQLQIKTRHNHFEEQAKQGMMLGGHPFFDDDNDQYYGSVCNNNNRGLYQRRRAAAEEARRRAEIERYYPRVKELKEQDSTSNLVQERQEYMIMLRQHQQEEEREYRRRVQDADMMRCLKEEERCGRQSFLARTRWDEGHHVDNEKEDEPEQHRIFRDPDGYLYRIPVEGLTYRDEATVIKEEGPPRKTNPKRRAAEPSERSYRTVRGESDQSLYRFPASFIHRIDEVETEEKLPRTSPLRTQAERMQKPGAMKETNNKNVSPTTNLLLYGTSTEPTAEQGNALLQESSKNANKQKNSRNRVTITVEDASDSETEDEFKSIWRNRRPSPGEWIEPVKDFKSL